MPNLWFKFYGMEYLGDPKIESLSPSERSCWISLLCFASESDGVVVNLSEDSLMRRAGLDPVDDAWDETLGALSKFSKLKMIETDDNGVITVLNWHKRQEKYMTPYERVKKFREKKRLITPDNANDNARIEKNRIEKRREEKRIPPASGGGEIPEIIKLFESVNPLIQKLYGSPPQRKAVERLLKKFGREKLEAMIAALPKINGQQYWPKSTTPVQLENNIATYMAKKSELETKQVANKIKAVIIT
jgi:hypothetical protein